MNREKSSRGVGEKKVQKGHRNVCFCTLVRFIEIELSLLEGMAGTTGLEPAASAVTGQRSNQLNYVPTYVVCA